MRVIALRITQNLGWQAKVGRVLRVRKVKNVVTWGPPESPPPVKERNKAELMARWRAKKSLNRPGFAGGRFV